MAVYDDYGSTRTCIPLVNFACGLLERSIGMITGLELEMRK